MSHSLGIVEFKNGERFYFEYNGTADICTQTLRNTTQEVYDNWRKNFDYKECSCGNEEEVIIYSSYGFGSTWKSKACKNCMIITKTDTEDVVEIDKIFNFETMEWE